jgi:serine/threonine protein kinase
MAPEYIRHGQFSVKSDVFSFGVIILEIVCGQRNTEIHDGESIEDLLGIVSFVPFNCYLANLNYGFRDFRVKNFIVNIVTILN